MCNKKQPKWLNEFLTKYRLIRIRHGFACLIPAREWMQFEVIKHKVNLVLKHFTLWLDYLQYISFKHQFNLTIFLSTHPSSHPSISVLDKGSVRVPWTYVEHWLSMHLWLAQITFYSNQYAKAEYIFVGYDDWRGDVENYYIHNIAKSKAVLPISVTTNLPSKRCNTHIVMQFTCISIYMPSKVCDYLTLPWPHVSKMGPRKLHLCVVQGHRRKNAYDTAIFRTPITGGCKIVCVVLRTLKL